ncbi:MAG: hypothetical protein L0226_16385 [Acidobacteria bacterium]|nr:hypothetical protein [Acidobacteriota bacterium]
MADDPKKKPSWSMFFDDKPLQPRPSACPNCGSSKVLGIVYGLPDFDKLPPKEERNFILGGCCIDLDSPGWYCDECEREW